MDAFHRKHELVVTPEGLWRRAFWFVHVARENNILLGLADVHMADLSPIGQLNSRYFFSEGLPQVDVVCLPGKKDFDIAYMHRTRIHDFYFDDIKVVPAFSHFNGYANVFPASGIAYQEWWLHRLRYAREGPRRRQWLMTLIHGIKVAAEFAHALQERIVLRVKGVGVCYANSHTRVR